MFQKRLQFFRSVLYLGDLCLVALCWLAAYFLRFNMPIIPVTKGVPDLELYLGLLALVLVVFLVVLQATGVYRRPWAALSQVTWQVFRATTVGVVLAVTFTYFLRPYDFSRLVFLQFYVLVTVSLICYRPLLRRAWVKFLPGHAGENTVIVGVEDLGRLVAGKISNHPVLGLRLVGFLTRRPEIVGQEVDGLPVLGVYNDLQEILERHQVHVVIIALPLAAHDRIEQVIASVQDEMVDIKIVPDVFRYTSLHGTVEEFEGLPIIGLRGSPMEGWSWVFKRGTDLLGTLVGLILLSPLLAGLAIAVKLSSPGPVLFRQKRMGLDGRVFNMLKFRSMRVDAEQDCGPVWACQDDPRRTRLGAFMRGTSLDELPQLFNVLRGEMSLVGPRPERPEFINHFRRSVPGYMLRHKVKAGITGWAQINGWRGNTSLERRIEHDLFYIENWSLGLDLKIIFLTLVRGFIHPNAY